MSEGPPSPDSFLSGRVGHVGPRRSRALRLLDRALDAAQVATGTQARLDRLAACAPRRSVLAVLVYRPSARRVPAIVRELRATRHDLRLALGPRGEPPEQLPADIVISREGGKFENANRLLRAARSDDHDWLIVVDDDVILPERFVDRMVGLCEWLDLGLAQPAQTLSSHAAWRVTRRRPVALARETDFVEIGPLTIVRRDVAAELTPFPELRWGWGLDLHWSALAHERGWRLGVLDALPVRHDEAGVASAYRHSEAVEEARRFLTGRPFVPSAEAGHTLAVHRRLG